MRLLFLRFIAIVLTLTAVSQSEGRPLETDAATDAPPNIIIIYADDLGYADVGCFGGVTPTPNIDRIAKEGRKFTSFYVAQAVCSASRTALLTGCYPNRVGILGALGPSAMHGIHEAETTLAETLRDKGYSTAIYGKWHLGHLPAFLPERHGFDDYFGLPYSNDMWPKHPTAKFPPLPLIEHEKTIELNPDQRQLTKWYGDRAAAFIERSKDRPFFLYLPHAMPHVPLFTSPEFDAKTRLGLYADVIAEIDHSVGKILQTLDRLNLAENTLVIFTSDNGPWLSYGNHAGSAGPLRQGKGTTFEGGVRVPCVMRWPGHIPPASECSQPLMTIDLLPTFAKISGAELPKLAIDGRDQSELLMAEEAPVNDSPYYFYWAGELQAIRQGKWKLHFPHNYPSIVTPGKDGSPGVAKQERIELSLFDVESDHGETTNVERLHPEIVAKLTALADEKRKELGDTAKTMKGSGVREPRRVAAKN
jgi:arylsulfatase A